MVCELVVIKKLLRKRNADLSTHRRGWPSRIGVVPIIKLKRSCHLSIPFNVPFASHQLAFFAQSQQNKQQKESYRYLHRSSQAS